MKHVPDYFFGQQSGADKDRSGAGYLGQAQEQFNLSRGFSDWNNHRDTVFDTEQGRDDAMMFGEHLGEPPGYGGYWDAGMRLVDNDLRNELNDTLGNPSSGLTGLRPARRRRIRPGLGVTHAQSHDNDYAARRELQHAFYLTRAGLPLDLHRRQQPRRHPRRERRRLPAPSRTRISSASTATRASRTCSTSTTTSPAAIRSGAGATRISSPTSASTSARTAA